MEAGQIERRVEDERRRETLDHKIEVDENRSRKRQRSEDLNQTLQQESSSKRKSMQGLMQDTTQQRQHINIRIHDKNSIAWKSQGDVVKAPEGGKEQLPNIRSGFISKRGNDKEADDAIRRLLSK